MNESMASGEFFRYQYQPILPDVKTGRRFSLPPAALVGWIPSVNGPPPAELAGSLSPNAQEALNTLLTTGNNPPPDSFLGPGEFVDYLERKDFRAALALDEIKIVTDRAGAFASVSFYHLIRCGYTPLPPAQKLFFWGGQGFGKSKVTVTPDEVRIRLSLWFKLGRLTSLAARALSGYWPASANAEIEVSIFRDPLRASIAFAGSSIPSQRLYVGWQDCRSDYDMLTSEPRRFEEFLELGYCNDALSWRTHLVEIPEERADIITF